MDLTYLFLNFLQSSFAWLHLKLRNCWLVFSAVSSLLQITAVCNFFTYIRYIHQGLVKQQDGKKRASGFLWWLDISVIKLTASLCVCSRTDVLGGDAAPQGNVPRQAWLLQRPAVTGAVLQSQQSLSWSPTPPWLLPHPTLALAPPPSFVWVFFVWERKTVFNHHKKRLKTVILVPVVITDLDFFGFWNMQHSSVSENWHVSKK